MGRISVGPRPLNRRVESPERALLASTRRRPASPPRNDWLLLSKLSTDSLVPDINLFRPASLSVLRNTANKRLALLLEYCPSITLFSPPTFFFFLSAAGVIKL